MSLASRSAAWLAGGVTAADPRIPDRNRVVQRYVLEYFAGRQPDKTFITFESGEEWSYAELLRRVRRVAAGLRDLGVDQGDHVASFLPNGRDALLVWWGLNYLGAVYVPVNPAYKGNLLAHVVGTADARLGIVDAERLPRLAEVGGGVEQTVGPDELDGSENADLELARPIEPWDTQAIWYTSGTTGPSKGVLSSYLHCYEMFGPTTMPFIGSDDRYLINMPLYHMGGSGLLNSMLHRGASVGFVEHFSATRFLRHARELETSVVFLLGVMASFVESQPPEPDDADTPLRTVFIIPVLDDMKRFAHRFGCDVYSIYNMTEICTPIITEPNPTLAGTCGRVRPGVDVRLMDANDCEVPPGEVGEFCVRSDVPWGMNHGYYKMPEATAAAWRNGWFHTGDAGRRDAEGNYFFVDRIKDVVRRRGVNISSLEVEIELTAHPGVGTAAVVGVPSEYAEEEILAIVVPADGYELEPKQLVEFLEPRLAEFMIPRYFRLAGSLPMTPTEKIRKVELRSLGITDDTWDREDPN